MKIAVIGGSGFIGTPLVRSLLDKGHKVTIIDKVKSETFPDISIKADICHQAGVTKALNESGAEVIFHLAAEHRDDVSPTSLYYDVNVGGTENICRSAEKANISRIIFVSSVAVYGANDDETTPIDETQTPYPANDYGHSKLKAEDVLKQWQQDDEGRSVAIIRPTAVFGAGSKGNVNMLITQIANKQFVMIGKGQNKKSVAYLGNVVAFLCYILDNPKKDDTYNYVDEPTPTTRQLVLTIGKAVHGDKFKFMTIPCWMGYWAGMICEMIYFFVGKKYPLTRLRAKKFCETTYFTAKKALSTGFKPPFDHTKAIKAKAHSDLST